MRGRLANERVTSAGGSSLREVGFALCTATVLAAMLGAYAASDSVVIELSVGLPLAFAVWGLFRDYHGPPAHRRAWAVGTAVTFLAGALAYAVAAVLDVFGGSAPAAIVFAILWGEHVDARTERASAPDHAAD